MSSESLKIVIIGAGIAGFSAARALRGQGHDIILLEHSKQLGEVGAAISTGPNATHILSQWGFDFTRAGSVNVKGMRIYSTEGKLVTDSDIDFKQTFGADLCAYHRADLHDELRRLATTSGDGIPGKPAVVRTGINIVDLNVETGEVRLDTGEVIQGDIIVGADGIRSLVRTYVLDEPIDAKLTGESLFRALIPAGVIKQGDPEIVAQIEEPYTYIWTFNHRRVIAYWCKDGTLFNVAAIVPDASIEGEATVAYENAKNVVDWKRYFDGASPAIQHIISAINHVNVFQLRILEPLPTWVKGRAILIGDAAHAMPPYQGQGGGQAIEDAEALGVYLESVVSPTTASDIHPTLLKVQAVRWERARRVQAQSLQVGTEWAQKAASSQESSLKGLDESESTRFFRWNSSYLGARDWAKKHGLAEPV